MSSSMRRLKSSLILFSVLGFFGAQPLWSTATESQDVSTLVVEVHINGIVNGSNSVVLKNASGFYASALDLSRWRFRDELLSDLQTISFNGEKYFPLSAYKDLKVSLDEQNLILRLEAPAELFKEIVIDVRKQKGERLRPKSSGFYLNYDFSYAGPAPSTLSALTDIDLFSPFGVGQSFFSINNINVNPTLVRLATTWTVDEPETMSTFRFGDSITRSAPYSSGVQFAGIQWERNFSTRPEFLQIPGLSLEGRAAVPSTIDLFLNNYKNWSTNVDQGPFRISGIPIITGSGDAVITETDLLGRQHTWLIPYYTGGSLLEKDLSDYSVSLGLTRKNLGTRSFDYSDFMSVLRYRVGLSNSLTLGLTTEFLRTLQTLGTDYDFALGNFALGQAAFAISNSEAGNGTLWQLGVQRTGVGLSFSSVLTYASQNFRNLRYFGTLAPPALQEQVFVSANTFLGGLSASFTYQQGYDNVNSALLTLNYSNNIFRGVSVQANSVFNLLGGGFSGALVSLSFSMDPFGQANSSLQYSNGIFTPQVGVNSNLPNGPGYGYNFALTGGDQPSANASFIANTQAADFTLNVAVEPQNINWQLDATGTIVLMDSNVFFSRPVGGSFALVKIPEIPGVNIQSSYQFAGSTNRDGLLLVPNLASYQGNDIQIDMASLPMDAVASSSTDLTIKPYFASGNLVEFDVKRIESATMRLVTEQGKAVPPGALAYLRPDLKKSFPVADKGTVYVTGLTPRNALLIVYGDERCEVNFEFTKQAEAIPFLGTFLCKSIGKN